MSEIRSENPDPGKESGISPEQNPDGNAAEIAAENREGMTGKKESDKTESVRAARLAIDALEDKKAEDIRVIDISSVSVLADYFIIAGGTNKSQIQAMADNVEEKLGRAGFPCRQVEGYQTANWVLLDFGDVIVHLFDPKNRLLYDLERIWRDGTQVDPDMLREEV